MGFFIAFLIMELIVALPTYFILIKVFKRRSIKIIALMCCVVSIAVGWTAGYRVTKDQMVSNYKIDATQQSINNYGRGLEQSEWTVLYRQYTNNPENVKKFHIGAAKAALPTSVIVAIILFLLAARHKKRVQEAVS
jgi:di/tricarboxylate transporter